MMLPHRSAPLRTLTLATTMWVVVACAPEPPADRDVPSAQIWIEVEGFMKLAGIT